MRRREIRGGYFAYCQLCEHDGSCELRHFEFMGVPPGDGIDRTPYNDHEDLTWAFTAFQRRSPRRHCTGRIRATDSMFLSLQCECATAVSSMAFGGICKKFTPTADGERLLSEHAEQLEAGEVSLQDILPDQEYPAEMYS